MKRLPRIGEGVRVPWGLESLAGEVLDVAAPDHALVAVPVEGSSGEALETVPVRIRVDILEELPPWRVKASRRGGASAGADAAGAWWVDAERNGEEASVEVRISGSLASRRSQAPLPDETAQVFQTDGRSAVAKFSYRYRLPRVIVVGTTGVFELNE